MPSILGMRRSSRIARGGVVLASPSPMSPLAAVHTWKPSARSAAATFASTSPRSSGCLRSHAIAVSVSVTAIGTTKHVPIDDRTTFEVGDGAKVDLPHADVVVLNRVFTPDPAKVEYARRVVEAFPVIGKGLFLEGAPGVGKTHLAVAVLKQVIEELSSILELLKTEY